MKVFGTFSKHLPLNIKVQEVGVTIADEQYAYTLNADGYPTNCNITYKIQAGLSLLGLNTRESVELIMK
jgi:hypothetical protein